MLSSSLAFDGIQYCVTMPDKDVTITAVWQEYLYVSFFEGLNLETQTADWMPDLAAFDTETGVHFNNNGLNSRDDQIAGDYAVQWYDASGSLLEEAPTDAGTYTIKVTLGETASEKYILAADTLTYTIAPLDLSKKTVGLNWPNGQPQYNGQQQLPDAVGATVYYNSNYDPLPKESYSFAPVEGKNCTSAGQAYCLIVGDGKNVVGQVEKSYYINRLSLTLPDAAERVYAYDGTPKATDFSNETVPEGYAFVEPLYWYEASSSTRLAEAPSDAGEYEVYVKYTPADTVNYSIEYRREPYTIEARELTADVRFDTSKVYDTGTGVTLTCTPTNVVEGDSILLTAMAVYDSPDVETGKTITVTFQLSGTDAKNYSVPDSYTVTDAEITPKEVTVHPEYPLVRVWDGTDTVAMTKTGWSVTGHYPAVDDLQIDLSAATARVETSDVGQDKPVIFENVVITGNEKGNYTIVFEERTIDIQVLDLGSGSVTVTFTGNTPVYTGSTVYPENAVVTVQPSGQEAFLLDSSLWEFAPDTGMNNSNAGTAYAYISATGASSNVTGKKYIQYTIDKASLTGVTAENETITYDGQPHGISVTGIDSTMTVYYGTSKEDCASVEPITCTNVADSKTIWYKVVSKNYEDFYGSATVTINAKPFTSSDVKLSGSLTYTGSEQTQAITVTEGITYEVSGNMATDVGTYELIVKGTGNYSGSVKLSWSIAQKSVTVTAKDQTITYGETISGTEITATGLVDGHSVIVTLTPSTANVTVSGTITARAAVITADGTDVTANYNISYTSGKLVIEPDTSKINALTTENVTSANEEDIKAVQAMMASAETDGIDDVTAAQWAAITANCEDLIDKIEAVEAENARIADTAADFELNTVKSSDKAALEQLAKDIEALLDTENLTEDERTALEAVLEQVEALIDVIEAAQDATDTENTEKVENVTAENVGLEDKEALEDAKADLEKALEDNSGNYTEEEKQTIQDEIQRIEDAIEALENVEDVTETITQLPETVEPDDEETTENILDAKKAYDELTDHEKSLVDESTKEKLDGLVAALTAYDIIKGDGGKWTKGSSYGLSFTANGPFSKLVGIEVDGKEVDSTYYTAESGSTIITLKQSFLKRLSTGEHTITLLYTDGETSGAFKILAQSTSPATGDDSNIMLWSGMLCVSTLGLVVLLADRKRRKATK